MNKQNEILKHNFFQYLDNAKGYSSESIIKFEKAIHLYELCSKSEDFGKFNSDKAMLFKEYLIENNYKENSFRTYLHHLKAFFTWLSNKNGYKRKINPDQIEYLNSSKGSNRLASQKVIISYPTHEEILRIVKSLPDKTEVELRNKCLIAFTYSTGMRDGAIRTLPFSAINIEKLFVVQDPRKGVDVKFSKIVYSNIFSLDNELIIVIKNYYQLLKSKGFTGMDPFFPQSKRLQQEGGLSFTGSTEISNVRWESLESIRTVFMESCRLTGSKYYYPHQFRHAALRRLLPCAKNALQIKALYQSFGHKNFITILESYANLDPVAQLEVLSKMNLNPDEKGKDTNVDLALSLINKIQLLDETKINGLINILNKL